MKGPRHTCANCGKRSGLDDLVSTAVAFGVHSKAFMIDVLVNGPKGASPSHEVDCSNCFQRFDGCSEWYDNEDIWMF